MMYIFDQILESFFPTAKAMTFVISVWLIRDTIKSFVFPHITFARGSAGSPSPTLSITSKWIVSLGRLEFHYRRDWVWLVILALNTLLFAVLPLTGRSTVSTERLSVVILTVFAIEVIAIIFNWWRSAPIIGVSSFLKFANRALISIAMLITLIGYLGFVVGSESLGRVLSKQLIFENPTSLPALICALVLAQIMSLEAPMRTEGWGVHHIVKVFYEIFWITLLVIMFVGVYFDTPELIMMELVLKTAVIMVACDGIKLFLPTMRGEYVEQMALYLMVPFGAIIVLSFWLRSVF